MTRKTDFKIIFYYKKTGKYALNVLAGALNETQATKHLDIGFATTQDMLIDSIHAAHEAGMRILVCWSFYSTQFHRIQNEVAYIRHQTSAEGVIHLAGGVHATAEPLQTLMAGFDYVAIGEGESIIVDVAIALLNQHELCNVRGIASLKQGEIVRNGKGETINLDDYPVAAPRYRKFGPIEITRGCIYACHFCQTPYINKARFRHRSIDRIAEAATIMRDHGLRDYRFITPTAMSYGSQDESVNLDAIETLLETMRGIVGKQRRIFFGTFPSEIRPEHISREVLELLKRYVDNDNLIIGGQSGSLRVLELSRRGHDVDSIERAVALCVDAGFQPNVDFLYGLPGETEQDAQATLALAHKLSEMGARIHNHTFMPLPGTPFRDQAPASLDPQTQQQLVNLTSSGKAYGQWQGQLQLSQQLASFRRHRHRQKT